MSSRRNFFFSVAALGVCMIFFGVPATGAASYSYTFTHDLHQGETASAVYDLQQYLLDQGYFNYPEPTGYFGPITFAGVKAWQLANCIPSTGYFGPISRGFVNGGPSLCATTMVTASTTAAPAVSADPTSTAMDTSTPTSPSTTPSIPSNEWEGGVSVSVATAPVISVTVSPSATTTNSGATTTFAATVNNSADQTVDWSAALGIIDPSSGAYTAPTVYATTTDTITAQADVDSTKTGTATVTIDPLPITVSISPSSTTVFSGGNATFAATVTNASTSLVTWSALLGIINASGTYTAPTLGTSTISETDTITAVSVANNAVMATATVTVQNSLVDWWKLNEGSGTIAYDSGSAGHNGTWNGTQSGPSSTYYTAPRPSSSFAYSGLFNGSNDYINPDLTINYSATSSFTWTVWVDLNSGINNDNVILGDRLNPIWVKLTPSSFEWYNGSLLSNTIPFNQWVNIAVVKSGNSFYYYENGNLQTSASSTEIPGSLPFYIGTDPNSNGDGYTWGSLSDVRIYNSALSQSQVQDIYNGN